MINHTQNIIVNCSIDKGWSFIINFSRSLIFDKFYTLVELPREYAVNTSYIFSVKCRYLLKNYHLEGSVINNSPPNRLELKFHDMKNNIDQYKIFELKKQKNQTLLSYHYQANFNNWIKDIILYPMTKASCFAELVYIKKAIESSEYLKEGEKVKTILH